MDITPEEIFKQQYLQEWVEPDHALMERVHRLSATQIQRELRCSPQEACSLRKQAMEYHRMQDKLKPYAGLVEKQ